MTTWRVSFVEPLPLSFTLLTRRAVMALVRTGMAAVPFVGVFRKDGAPGRDGAGEITGTVEGAGAVEGSAWRPRISFSFWAVSFPPGEQSRRLFSWPDAIASEEVLQR